MHVDRPPPARYPMIGPVLVALLLIIGGLVVLRRRFAVIDVSGPSMEPTFYTGDRVLVRRVALDRVCRGDVVVVERPDRPGRWPLPAHRGVAGRNWLIKRAAALPGDQVPPEVGERDAVVPDGHLVVLGDRADASFDSRSCGYFPADRLLGVVTRRLTRAS